MTGDQNRPLQPGPRRACHRRQHARPKTRRPQANRASRPSGRYMAVAPIDAPVRAEQTPFEASSQRVRRRYESACAPAPTAIGAGDHGRTLAVRTRRSHCPKHTAARGTPVLGTNVSADPRVPRHRWTSASHSVARAIRIHQRACPARQRIDDCIRRRPGSRGAIALATKEGQAPPEPMTVLSREARQTSECGPVADR